MVVLPLATWSPTTRAGWTATAPGRVGLNELQRRLGDGVRLLEAGGFWGNVQWRGAGSAWLA